MENLRLSLSLKRIFRLLIAIFNQYHGVFNSLLGERGFYGMRSELSNKMFERLESDASAMGLKNLLSSMRAKSLVVSKNCILP